MSTNYKDLVAEKAKLAQLMQAVVSKLAKAAEAAKEEAIHAMRASVQEFNIAPLDIFPDLVLAKPKKKPVPAGAKYMDPHTGKTWNGRGKPPAWIAEQNRADFLMEPAA